MALIAVYAALCAAAICGDLYTRVRKGAREHLAMSSAAPMRFTGIVLGCRVNGDDPSGCLEERLETGLALYRSGSVQRLLLSGDHGSRGYDEVNAMRTWLLHRGVDTAHVFLDHAGFDTYDTMVRARSVFGVQDALVVSQLFHLPRAVYIARSIGIDAVGVEADPIGGSACAGSRMREPLACVKAVLNVWMGADPAFYGPAIPITGRPEASLDRR